MDPLDWIAKEDRQWRRLGAIVPPAGIDLPEGGLMDLIPALVKKYKRPEPLRPLVNLLERALVEPVRAVVHVMPRVGKTETCLIAIPYWLRKRPETPIMYFAHTGGLARSKSAKARGYALDAGVRLSTSSKSKVEWLVVDEHGRETGGGLRAFGIDGGAIGHGARIIMIDDPHKDRAAAESAISRDAVWEAITSTVMSRLEPGGSVILIMQRWHPDDAASRAIALGWEYVCITPFANNDEVAARSFWPERFPDAHWQELRRSTIPYFWESQYMGRPVAREDRVLADPILCSLRDIPATGIAEAIGVDLSHTNRSRSDPHAAVAWRRAPDVTEPWTDPATGRTSMRTRRRFYVIDCRSRRAALTSETVNGRKVPGFTSDLIAMRDAYPVAGRRMRMYFGGTESAILSLLAKLPPEERVTIDAVRAGADKYVRASPLGAALRAGEVFVPRDAPWASDLLAEWAQFTGNPNGIDNITDAAAAGFDAVAVGGGMRAQGGGTSEAARLSQGV